jgi:hypothetical protein
MENQCVYSFYQNNTGGIISIALVFAVKFYQDPDQFYGNLILIIDDEYKTNGMKTAVYQRLIPAPLGDTMKHLEELMVEIKETHLDRIFRQYMVKTFNETKDPVYQTELLGSKPFKKMEEDELMRIYRNGYFVEELKKILRLIPECKFQDFFGSVVRQRVYEMEDITEKSPGWS